jgi:hypothetical protein
MSIEDPVSPDQRRRSILFCGMKGAAEYCEL